MAELMFKVGAGAGYQDGDVLCAFTDRHIRCVHGQHICFPKVETGRTVTAQWRDETGRIRTWTGRERRLADKDANGIMPAGSLARMALETTCEFLFVRLSQNECVRVRLSNGEELRFRSGEPFEMDGTLIAMDIELHARHRRESLLASVFGSVGREAWYGGTTDLSDAAIESVWDGIEAATEHRRNSDAHRFWPAGTQDVISHAVVPAISFTDDKAAELVSPIIENGEMTQQRRFRAFSLQVVATTLGVPVSDLRDPAVSVDRRRDVAPRAISELLWDKRESLPATPVLGAA